MRRTRRPKSLAELNLARHDATTSPAVMSYRQPVASAAARVRILGLDPGSLCTGYAVIETGPRVSYVVSGSIRARGSLPERLQEIFAGVDKLANEYQPDEVAIERVFMHRNADSALKLGQARGAALSATFAVRPRVFEYAPREVKLAVVGTGGAQKEQVQLMVRSLLNLSGRMGADAADALAIALCHAYSRSLNGQLRELAAGSAQ
ncbi:crossover junction endodeoxyribonuclease RuvC [Steroidobacter sp.]|uniref:crossover junction endodeoxyribonuclease RuvC n=1 Tax=Steroidobacter sp. TaxID=1978227 RepID=UPI0025DE45F3|nr:crossover junction endodeoxyribonuclease RuvC [Steroidobacter sp.]